MQEKQEVKPQKVSPNSKKPVNSQLHAESQENVNRWTDDGRKEGSWGTD